MNNYQEIDDLLAELGLTMDIESGPVRATSENGWHHNAYSVVIRRNGDIVVRTSYNMGLARKDAPTLRDVLWSLLMDGRAYFNDYDFVGWAVDYDYDTDSRKAERLFNKYVNMGKTLEDALGRDSIEMLLTVYEGY